MRRRPRYICFLLTFLACCYADIEPDIKACIDKYELSFFCDLKLFYDAKKVCEDKGSYLVKIDNINMTNIIKNVINTIDQSGCRNDENLFGFHAGATADSNHRWTWLDGSRVYQIGEDGYQNWQEGQPDDAEGKEDCLRLSSWTTKWFDSPCNGTGEQKYYICQKDLTPNIEIEELSYKEIKCSITSGTSVNQVEWRRNKKTVSTTQNHSVYQKLSSRTSTLCYENATINDEGEYSCVTWDKNNEHNKATIIKIIQINVTATIEVIISSPCNCSLIIHWHPNKRALGIPHRITVKDSMSEEVMKKIIETPIKHVQQVTEISDLQPFTEYNIQILTYKNKESCTDENTANASATTWGVVIENAFLRQISDEDTCIINWNWPYDISTLFKLKVHSDAGVNISFVNNTDNNLIFSFKMQPEQAYTVQIQAIGGKELCPEPRNVGGTCRGRDLRTISESGFTTDLFQVNSLSDIIMIVIPVSVGVLVILIIAGIVIYCKRHRSQNVKIFKKNPIYGVTNNVALGSIYDHFHSSADKQHSDQPGESTLKLSQQSQEVVFNPLYGDIGVNTSLENQNIDVEAATEDNDAPVYAAINKTNPNEVSTA